MRISALPVKYQVNFRDGILFMREVADQCPINHPSRLEQAVLDGQLINTGKPLIRLDHIDLPASKPRWLAEWHAEKFALHCDSRQQVQEWATRFNEVLDEEQTYSGFKTKDSVGDVFEVYREK